MSTNQAPTVDFCKIMQTELHSFLTASREFGLPLSALADMVQHAFEIEKTFIESGLQTLQSQKSRLANLLDDLSRSLREIQEFRDRNRHVQEFFNHLAAVAESVVALSWVTLERTPVQFIRDMKEAGDYFGNRVLSANRGNSQHLNWWNKWTAVLKALEEYVRRHHLTGFAYASEASTKAPVGIPVAPPLPPREPNPPIDAGGDAMRNALLNQLNQGVDIVQMLRPVRSQAPVTPASAVPQPPVSAQVARPAVHTQVQTPPKLMLEGRKWHVEHYKNTTGLTIVANEMSESVAMYKCEKTEVDIQNKINGATIDNCKRSTVVFRDVISTVELIRCQYMTIQLIGHVPSINLDSCDSVQIFLSEKSLDTEIITSKTTSLNVCLLSNDGDYVELPVPEQIKTTIVNGSLRSTVVQQI